MTMPSPLRTSPNKVHSNSLFLEATMLPGQRQGQGKFLGPMVIRMDAWKQQVLQTAASLEIDIPLHYLALPTTEVECERPLACPVCTAEFLRSLLLRGACVRLTPAIEVLTSRASLCLPSPLLEKSWSGRILLESFSALHIRHDFLQMPIACFNDFNDLKA